MRVFTNKQSAFLLLLLIVGFTGYTQQLVQTPKDLYLLCQHDDRFVGKPLKYLFSELKPRVTFVFAREGWKPEVAPLFAFFFTSRVVYDQYRRANQFPLQLKVYVSEPFKWDQEKRAAKDGMHRLDWTKEDEERYGDLVVTAINVTGMYKEGD